MPSRSIHTWQSQRLLALDELEIVYRQAWGPNRTRRLAAQQIAQACCMLLTSQFQGFCRDKYGEVVDHLVAHFAPSALRGVFRDQFTVGLKLDRGNPNPGNLGADFGRLGVRL